MSIQANVLNEKLNVDLYLHSGYKGRPDKWTYDDIPENIPDKKYSEGGQLAVFESNARFKAIVAGRRWGKTIYAVITMIIKAMTMPNARIWYISPFYAQSKEIAWKLLKRYLPPQLKVKINESELRVDFLETGAEIALKGADKPESLEGVGLHYVVIDEYGAIKFLAWEESIRPMLSDTGGDALFIGKAKGVGNNFHDVYLRGLRGEAGFKSWRFPSLDNPAIPVDEIKNAEEHQCEAIHRQEHWACFEEFAGLIYTEFNPKTHVVSEVPNLENMISVVAIDPAITGVHAWLHCYIDSEGNIYVAGEYYEKDKRVEEVVPTLPKAHFYIIDNTFASQKTVLKEGKYYSIVDEYAGHNIRVIPGESDEFAGCMRTKEFFANNRITISDKCIHLWKEELPTYHWTETKETSRGETKPRPYKKNDHLNDCLRYIVMSRIKASEEQIKVKPHKMSVEFELQKMLRDEKDWKTKWTPVHN